jgi:general secretion pathway protein E
MPPPPQYTFEWVLEVLLRSGLLLEEHRRTAMARENTERARLLKKRRDALTGRFRRHADLAPVELVASFRFPIPGRPNEVLDEDKVCEAVARACGVPYMKLDFLRLDANLVTQTLSRPFAHRNGVIAVQRDNTTLTVAMVNPFDRGLRDSLQALTGLQVRAALSPPSDIHRAIAEIYGFRQSVREANLELSPQANDIKNLEGFSQLSGLEALEGSSEPVVAAVDYLLHHAFDQRASDLHLEPHRDEANVRMRIDGVLHTIHRVPKPVYAAMASRLKVMGRMDITSRKPQDGRFKAGWTDTEVELRLSSVPTVHGDKLVLRIQDPNALVKDLGELGLLDDERQRFETWIARPHGMIIVTGPTGSGKTTTLYSALQAIASPETNIVTIEDPIEFVQEGLTQIQANPKTGTGFGEVLRSVLRQDPDVIMVGEVRDEETAMEAAQAAMTGHLVFTTLHTNDAIGAVSRLSNLGLPPHLVAASLSGVMAQRLVRRVCPSCSRDVTLTADELKLLGVTHPEEYAGRLLARRGEGCPRCRHTGYMGRGGIFEVLGINRRLRQMLSDGVTPDALALAARQEGVRSLREHAIHKVAAGVTTVEEAISATADAEDRT